MGRPQIILTSTNKTASFTVFVVCGWREEAVAGVCLRTYLVHSTYVFLVMYQGYESRKNCKPSCTYIILCLVAIVSVSDFYVPSFLVERGGGNEILFH